MQHVRSLTSFLMQYAGSEMFRAHMPGHKGRVLPGYTALQGAYAWDITEIAGADSLFEASGILREAEHRIAALYGSGDACLSAEGSTLCIQAMLAKMKAENRHIIAARTVHRAFLNACVLLDLDITWVLPRSGSLIAGTYAPEDFAEALAQTDGAACVYVTSPDYCGNMQDIAALSAVCRKYGARLLVDNAHGAHLAFLPESRHPMTLGADFCCDSFHKTLPSLTGAAVLHCAAPCAMEMKQYMQLFGSTSPSYLIMQSMEAAADWLADGGAAAVHRCAENAEKLRKSFPQYDFVGDDPLHLTIQADGNALAEALRRKGVECEYADSTCLVLLLSPMLEERDFARLYTVLSGCAPNPPATLPPLPALPEQAMPLREAALSAWECIPVTAAAGRICGMVQVPCPPAVPLVVSGERITPEWAALMQFFGIPEVLVLRSA